MGGIEVQGEGRQAAEPGKRARRLWTAEEKRRIVRESQRPGAVRQEVAQRHGVHVSVMNRWRTEQPSGASPAKKTVKPVRLPLLCPAGLAIPSWSFSPIRTSRSIPTIWSGPESHPDGPKICWTELGAKQVGMIQSLIVTCRLHSVDPYTYLIDVLQRIAEHPASRVTKHTPDCGSSTFAAEPMLSDMHRFSV